MARNKKRNNKPRREWPKVSLPKPKLNLAEDTKRGIAILIFAALAGVSVLSLLNLAGALGHAMAHAVG